MHEKTRATSQDKVRVETEVLEAAAVVGVKMAHCDAIDLFRSKLDASRGRALREHFPDRMWAVNQQPIIIEPQGKAGSVVQRGECVANSKGN
jgi:hypothetical protein